MYNHSGFHRPFSTGWMTLSTPWEASACSSSLGCCKCVIAEFHPRSNDTEGQTGKERLSPDDLKVHCLSHTDSLTDIMSADRPLKDTQSFRYTIVMEAHTVYEVCHAWEMPLIVICSLSHDTAKYFYHSCQHTEKSQICELLSSCREEITQCQNWQHNQPGTHLGT